MYITLANLPEASVHVYSVLANLPKLSVHVYSVLANLPKISVHVYSVLANLPKPSVHVYSVLANLPKPSVLNSFSLFAAHTTITIIFNLFFSRIAIISKVAVARMIYVEPCTSEYSRTAIRTVCYGQNFRF